MERLVDWKRRDHGAGSMRVDVAPTLDLLGRLGHGPDELCELAERNGLVYEAVPNPEETLSRAVALAGDDGWLLVTGSLRLAGSKTLAASL